MPEDEDKLPDTEQEFDRLVGKLNAERDQDRSEIKDAMEGLAHACRSFYDALSDEGFDEDQALQLTMTWLVEAT